MARSRIMERERRTTLALRFSCVFSPNPPGIAGRLRKAQQNKQMSGAFGLFEAANFRVLVNERVRVKRGDKCPSYSTLLISVAHIN